MTTISDTTHIGFARYARLYYRAAVAADDVIGHDRGYEINAPPPVMFLIAHAIELTFKAFLIHRGAIERDLRRVGHNLVAAWEAGRVVGIEEHLDLIPDEIAMLELISHLHDSNELRYIETGYKQYPVFGPLDALACKIQDSIFPAIGAR